MNELLKSNRNLWDLFTRKEEYSAPFLDNKNRFPYYCSKHRNVLKPEVSQFLIKNGLKIEYPDNRRFAVCMTHDYCRIRPTNLEILYEAARALRRLHFRKSLTILLSRVIKKLNPILDLTRVMDLEEKYGAKSSFYFLALDKGNLGFSYKIDEIKEELRDITNRGWEIGLHIGYEAYTEKNQLRKEKENLEKVIGRPIIGCRNHGLVFQVPTTWELLKEAGFKYDTTFGYADCVGFRNGMCHPFKPFNLNNNEYIDIMEIPLIIMDETLITYMRLDLTKIWDITKELIDTVEKCRGVITILWHGDVLLSGGMGKLYERILQYCHEKNAWVTSAENIYRHFAT